MKWLALQEVMIFGCLYSCLSLAYKFDILTGYTLLKHIQRRPLGIALIAIYTWSFHYINKHKVYLCSVYITTYIYMIYHPSYYKQEVRMIYL